MSSSNPNRQNRGSRFIAALQRTNWIEEQQSASEARGASTEKIYHVTSTAAKRLLLVGTIVGVGGLLHFPVAWPWAVPICIASAILLTLCGALLLALIVEMTKDKEHRRSRSTDKEFASDLHQIFAIDTGVLEKAEYWGVPATLVNAYGTRKLLYREALVWLALSQRVSDHPREESVLHEFQRLVVSPYLCQESVDKLENIKSAVKDLLELLNSSPDSTGFRLEWSDKWFLEIGHDTCTEAKLWAFSIYWAQSYGTICAALANRC